MNNDYASKRIVVMGLGKFGGGVGVSRYLATQGADVLVTDTKQPEELKDSLAMLNGLPIEYRLGQHNISDFTTADLIVVNPAVNHRNNRYLRAATAGGIPMTTEICLAIKQFPARTKTIAVTGTAGKSTVTSMIGHILKGLPSNSQVHVGGNIGGSLLNRITDIDANDWVVLELSSYMLDHWDTVKWSPHIAVFTNLFPNHLDRHITYESYANAKMNLFRYQVPGDVLILDRNIQDDVLNQAKCYRPEIITIECRQWPLKVPGKHNQLNATFAATACIHAGVDIDTINRRLNTYQGLPHRLQLVCERQGVRYINDSKSTTPQASELAINSLYEVNKQLHIILGGYDKGSDLSHLAQYASSKCSVIYTIGSTGPTIASEALAGKAKVIECHEVDQAVKESITRTTAGDTVVLSPGCASWDQFNDYEQRGAAFAASILKYSQD